MYALLNKGLEIRFDEQRPNASPDHREVVYRYSGGIIDFARHLNASKEALFRKVAYFEQTERNQEVEVALQWNTGFYEGIHSFANGIGTGEGGMHEEGFKKALTNVVNKYGKAKSLLKEKDDNLTGEDIRESELFIVEGDSAGGPAIKARDPATQAILPIRGKILNVERARIDKMLKNTEIQALITAIGAGVGDEFDVAKIRYGKVVLLT